jgi:hypothetical protein
MSVTVNGVKIDTIVAEAKTAARIAAEQFFQEKLNGRDQFACGFAWVDIFGVKGNTKLGRALKEAGVRKSHTGAFQIWNPADMYVQNVDTLEAGAQAAADVFKKYGFSAYAGSRLD